MENIYVHNCPYSELVGDACIWDFTTMDIHQSAYFLGSKPTRKRLAGVYRVITASTDAMTTIELLEDKQVIIRSDRGISRGTWGIRMESAGKGYARENVVCSIWIKSDLMKQKYMCIFERDGVMILVPLKKGLLRKVFALLKENFDYTCCLFLVREQKSEVQTVKQFTSYVKNVYLRNEEDKKIASTVSIGPKRGLVYLIAIFGAILFTQSVMAFSKMNIGFSPYVLMIPMFVFVAFIVWLNAKFEDMRIDRAKTYAQNFRKTHAESEIPNMSYKWPYDEGWSGL